MNIQTNCLADGFARLFGDVVDMSRKRIESAFIHPRAIKISIPSESLWRMPINFVAAGEPQSRKTKEASRILLERPRDQFNRGAGHMMDML